MTLKEMNDGSYEIKAVLDFGFPNTQIVILEEITE